MMHEKIGWGIIQKIHLCHPVSLQCFFSSPILLLLLILMAVAELEEFKGQVTVWGREKLSSQGTDGEDWRFLPWQGTMDRNALWECTGVVVTAVIRMCLNTQSEDSYKMRNSTLMEFTPPVALREEISFNVAACEWSLRGRSRVRICVQRGCGQSCVQVCVQVSWRQLPSGV